MAEQIPQAWIDQEVTVFYDTEGGKQTGTLVSVSEQGLVVRSEPGERNEGTFWYPLTSVIRLKQGRAAKRGTRRTRALTKF
jgi:hypothetical protein